MKRFRKLPEGSPRHWAHVVDARAGPGVKNFVKLRRRESCRERARERDYERKHVWRRKSRKAPVHAKEGETEGWEQVGCISVYAWVVVPTARLCLNESKNDHQPP